MKYYKVSRDIDRIPRRYNSKRDFLVRNELFTPGEVKKYSIPMVYIEEVDVKPKETYFFFGARFSDKYGDWRGE